jgi:dolichol-phosphate mannosyltransferase
MYELTVVIPTLNERGNIDPLLERIDQALAGVRWEAIFVDDDSTDGTTDHLHAVAERRANVRLIHRIGRRGLSSACIEGMLASSAPLMAVMDADLQHDANLLPKMFAAMRSEDLDLAIGSRFAEGGDVGTFSRWRQTMSAVSKWMSRPVVKAELKDPMSGFFIIRRAFFDETVRRLSGSGFKILLDLFASAARPVKFREFPYRFGTRLSGKSKLDILVTIEYVNLVADKLIGHWVPIRFVIFVLVGLLGALIHVAVLGLTYRTLGASFIVAQIIATITAMTSNFFFNNYITYYDQRLRGFDLLRGLLSFYLACAVGAFANFLVAEFLYEQGVLWLLAGLLGAVVGSVWNYGVTSTFTWRSVGKTKRRRPKSEVS